MNMTKSEAVALLGGNLASAAMRIGVTIQAVSSWPDVLSDRLSDRVQAALYRDLMRDIEAKHRRPQKPAKPESATTCDQTA